MKPRDSRETLSSTSWIEMYHHKNGSCERIGKDLYVGSCCGVTGRFLPVDGGSYQSFFDIMLILQHQSECLKNRQLLWWGKFQLCRMPEGGLRRHPRDVKYITMRRLLRLVRRLEWEIYVDMLEWLERRYILMAKISFSLGRNNKGKFEPLKL